MKIRIATPADAGQLATVNVAAWQTAYRGLLPDRLLDKLSVSHSQQRWQNRFTENSTQTLVGEMEGRVIGYVTIGPSRDNDTDERVGEIFALYLHPRVWRHGYGRQLCAQALASLREQGFAEVKLWVLRDNQRAIKFYKAVGFMADGAIKKDTRKDGAVLHQIRFRQFL